MKLNKIMFFFCVGLPVCVCLRIFQIVFTIELETGFYLTKFETAGKGIMAVIFLFCLFLLWFAFKSYNSPESAPKTNIAMALISFVFGAAVALQGFGEGSYYILASNWQNILMQIASIAAAVYFVIFAINKFVPFEFPPILHIIPCCFLILRTVFVFINISSLAYISDNIFLLAAYCTSLLFFVNFAKLYNGIDSDKNFRKLLSWGLVSGTLCLTQSIPHIVVNIASGNRYLHISHFANISLLFMGLFILVFLVSHFYVSKKN